MWDYIPKDLEDKAGVSDLIDKSMQAFDALELCRNLLVRGLSSAGREQKLAGQELEARIT